MSSALVAFKRRHRNRLAIAALDIFAGWSYFWCFSYFSNFHYFCYFSTFLRTAVYGKNIYETVGYEEKSFEK
jgi:hypothetical protein